MGVSVIAVANLWKRYRRPHMKVTSVKEATLNFLRGERGHDEFWALRDISFAVEAGEVIGVVKGRVCPLLELGTGFHPELTGRENVYMNASLLGLSHRETEQRYDDIVEFAELPEVMNAPVKMYSTGMVIRLGFSIAVHLDPEVLLIDEVLGVGDEHFQRKSLEKLLEFKREGRTIFVVSHNLRAVASICERAIWLDWGRIVKDEDADEVIAKYKAAVEAWERSVAEAKAADAGQS